MFFGAARLDGAPPPEILPFCQAHPRAAGTLTAQSTVKTVGTNRILVIRARMQDDPAEPFTHSEVDRMMQEANEAFVSNSYGNFRLEWTITPIVTLPGDHAVYEPGGFYQILTDAREAAKQAGYDYETYDLDLTRHTPVAGLREGEANIGSPGARIGSSQAWVVVHEIGHNLGFFHANFWDTAGPQTSPYQAPPFPTNIDSIPDKESIPFDEDSLLGHETIYGLGVNEEYGDHWDIMGYGQERFNAVYRSQIGWLPASAVTVPSNGVYRIHAVARTNLVEGESRALRLPAAGGLALSRDLWMQFNPGLNDWLNRGLQIHWGGPGTSSSHLLDFTPGSAARRDDSPLPLGRTWTAPDGGLHVTPTVVGQDESGEWMEVLVHSRVEGANAAAQLTLTASKTSVQIDEAVEFIADAADPDGDKLQYFWDFGDSSISANTNRLRKSWKAAGEYSVICETSDGRGGVTSRHVLVSVGQHRTFHISGWVRDEQGRPLANARIHNSNAGRGYRYTYSDSSGAYTLPGIPAGRQSFGAFLYTWRVQPENFQIPIDVSSNLAEMNFVVKAAPRVFVSMQPSISENNADAPVLVEFTREGATNESLTVSFAITGTAQPNQDYAGFMIPTITFAPGAAKYLLPLQVLNDRLDEPEEDIVIEVSTPTFARRNAGQTNEYQVFYPGWELAENGGATMWVQTGPEYFPGGAPAVLNIQDNDEPTDQVVSVRAGESIGVENPRIDTGFIIERRGNIVEPLAVSFAVTGTAQEAIDYEVLFNGSREITFEPGRTNVLVPIVPLVDGVTEGLEHVTIQLLPREGEYELESELATVSMKDDLSYPVTMLIKFAKTGDLLLDITGQPGKLHVLEESSDLAEWTEIRNAMLFSSNWVLILPRPNDARPRFYRVLRPEANPSPAGK